MTTGVGLDIDIDTDVIQLLDFEPTIPCEGTNHPAGLSGHDPEAPGAYMVCSPCCGPKVIQCAGRVAQMRSQFDLYCSTCGTAHPVSDYSFVPLDNL